MPDVVWSIRWTYIMIIASPNVPMFNKSLGRLYVPWCKGSFRPLIHPLTSNGLDTDGRFSFTQLPAAVCLISYDFAGKHIKIIAPCNLTLYPFVSRSSWISGELLVNRQCAHCYFLASAPLQKCLLMCTHIRVCRCVHISVYIKENVDEKETKKYGKC